MHHPACAFPEEWAYNLDKHTFLLVIKLLKDALFRSTAIPAERQSQVGILNDDYFPYRRSCCSDTDLDRRYDKVSVEAPRIDNFLSSRHECKVMHTSSKSN